MGCWSTTKTIFTFLGKLFAMIPVIIVLSIVIVDYCSFIGWAVAQSSNQTINHITLIVFVTLIMTVLAVLTVWSYIATVLTSSSVKDHPPPPDYFRRFELAYPEQSIKLCVKCDNAPKPLRAHHCSICGVCINRMDHHCPWVMNCVGFNNYKHFCLFLFYATLACWMYQIAGLSFIQSLFQSRNASNLSFAQMLASLITGAFAIALSFFTLFHLSLVLAGKTTIEVKAQRTNRAGSELIDRFDAGYRRNWEAVFGEKPLLWFLPINNSGNPYEADFDDDEIDLESPEHALITPNRPEDHQSFVNDSLSSTTDEHKSNEVLQEITSHL